MILNITEASSEKFASGLAQPSDVFREEWKRTIARGSTNSGLVNFVNFI